MNEFQAIGRLIRDPELKLDKYNNPITNFTLAIDKELSKDKKTYLEEKNIPVCDFVKFIAFGDTAKMIVNYTEKGNRLYASGRLQTRSYTDDNNCKKYITEIYVRKIEIIDWKKV